MKIDKVTVCDPIKNWIELLKKFDFKIVEEKVKDFHFHEVYFKMKGETVDEITNLTVEGINKVTPNLYTCNCHWSTVELEINEN
mgnify:CR=1 FL=1